MKPLYWGFLVALIAVSAGLFRFSLDYPYAGYDDIYAVTTSPALRFQVTSWKEMFKQDYWGHPLSDANMSNTQWRPLILTTFRLSYTAYCPDAILVSDSPCLRYFHRDNVAMHVICSVLVFYFGRRLRLRDSNAAFAAMYFAAQPVHLESIVMIYGRADILCAIFSLLAMCEAVNSAECLNINDPRNTEEVSVPVPAEEKDAEDSKDGENAPAKKKTIRKLSKRAIRKSVMHSFFIVLLTFLATVSKEVGVTVSLLIPFITTYIWYVDSRDEKSESPKTVYGLFNLHIFIRDAFVYAWNTPIIPKLQLVLGVVEFLLVNILRKLLIPRWAPPFQFVDNPYPFIPLLPRVLSLGYLHARYLYYLVYPLNTAPNYGYNSFPIVFSFSDPRNIVTVLAYLLVFGTAFVALFRQKWLVLLLVGWGVFVFLPSSNIFFAVGTTFADRLLYLPSIPFGYLFGLVFETIYDFFDVRAQKLEEEFKKEATGSTTTTTTDSTKETTAATPETKSAPVASAKPAATAAAPTASKKKKNSKKTGKKQSGYDSDSDWDETVDDGEAEEVAEGVAVDEDDLPVNFYSLARTAVIAVAICVCVLYAVWTMYRSQFWADSRTMWAHNVEQFPDNVVVQFNSALEEQFACNYNKSIAAFDKLTKQMEDDPYLNGKFARIHDSAMASAKKMREQLQVINTINNMTLEDVVRLGNTVIEVLRTNTTREFSVGNSGNITIDAPISKVLLENIAISDRLGYLPQLNEQIIGAYTVALGLTDTEKDGYKVMVYCLKPRLTKRGDNFAIVQDSINFWSKKYNGQV